MANQPPPYDEASNPQQQPQKESKFAAFGAKANLFAQKVGKPFNKLSNKLGAEAFFPTSLDGEIDKVSWLDGDCFLTY